MDVKTRDGMDLNEYHKSVTGKAIKHKLVPAAETDHWGGPWMINGWAHFLVVLFRVKSGGKQCFISVSGTDDFDMAIRDLDLSDALDLYEKIKAGMSCEKLEKLGFVRGN